MTLKVSVVIFSLLIANSCAQISIDDLIGQVFHNTTPTKVETATQDGESGGYKSCGLQKECVPKHLCKDGAIITAGETLIDIRINDDVCKYNELCCDLTNKRPELVIPPVPHDGCGWRNNYRIEYKITGDIDNESPFVEFPWMVAILRTEDADGELVYLYDCGGSIITPNVVITAAHCVNNRVAHQLVVRGGEWHTQDTNEIWGHVDRPVKEIVSHEKYNKGALNNDIALLILEAPFVWLESIRPICLPEPTTNFDYSRCYAIGWNKYKVRGKYRVVSEKIELPVVPRDTCQSQLRQTRLGLNFTLHDSFLCAGGEKEMNNCKGDEGSPLACPIPGVKNRYYQAGIIYSGVGCSEENVPGIYANIAYLRPWISEKLAALGIEFTHFTP